MRKKICFYTKINQNTLSLFPPTTSKFHCSGPAWDDTSKSIANLGCRCPACSSLHGPVLFTSFGLQPSSLLLLLLLLLLILVVFQDSISYKCSTTQNNLLPLSVTWRRFLQSPEENQQALPNYMLLSRCLNAHNLLCFPNKRFQCSQGIKAWNATYMYYFICIIWH